MNSKKIIIFLALTLILAIVLVTYLSEKDKVSDFFDNTKAEAQPFDPKNVTYNLDGKVIKLKDGLFVSNDDVTLAWKETVKYIDVTALGDIDNDGVPDVTFVLLRETSAGEKFNYIATLLNKNGGSISLSPLMVGDRIVLQKLYYENGNIILNYLERKPGQGFEVEPTIADTIILKYDHGEGQMKYISELSEGDVDISKFSLTMKPWRWVSTTYRNRKISRPHDDDTFLLTWNSDETFYSSTDCNSLNGYFSQNRNSIETKNIISTLKACPDSMEQEYKEMISDVKEYEFSPRGELLIRLNKDQGLMVFK